MLKGQLKGHKNLVVTWALGLSNRKQAQQSQLFNWATLDPIRKGLTKDLVFSLGPAYKTTTFH